MLTQRFRLRCYMRRSTLLRHLTRLRCSAYAAEMAWRSLGPLSAAALSNRAIELLRVVSLLFVHEMSSFSASCLIKRSLNSSAAAETVIGRWNHLRRTRSGINYRLQTQLILHHHSLDLDSLGWTSLVVLAEVPYCQHPHIPVARLSSLWLTESV